MTAVPKEQPGWLGTVLHNRGRPHGRRRDQPFPLPLYHDPFSKGNYGRKLEDGLLSPTAAYQRTSLFTYGWSSLTPPDPGHYVYLILLPSIEGMGVYWKESDAGLDETYMHFTNPQFLDHMENQTLRDNIAGIRLVSKGIKFKTTPHNNPLVFGSWEAMTSPLLLADIPWASLLTTDFSASSTYQSGTMEDLTLGIGGNENLQFKLNSTSDAHPFIIPSTDDDIDPNFDALVIKFSNIAARLNCTVTSNFEVSYVPGSPKATTQTLSLTAPTFPADLAKTVQPLPGALISDQYVLA